MRAAADCPPTHGAATAVAPKPTHRYLPTDTHLTGLAQSRLITFFPLILILSKDAPFSRWMVRQAHHERMKKTLHRPCAWRKLRKLLAYTTAGEFRHYGAGYVDDVFGGIRSLTEVRKRLGQLKISVPTYRLSNRLWGLQRRRQVKLGGAVAQGEGLLRSVSRQAKPVEQSMPFFIVPRGQREDGDGGIRWGCRAASTRFWRFATPLTSLHPRPSLLGHTSRRHLRPQEWCRF